MAVLLLWTGGFALGHGGHTYPFIPVGSMIEEEGLGVGFGYGERPPVVAAHWPWAVPAVCLALSAAGAVLLLVGRARGADPAPGPAGLVAALGAGQFLGMLPASVYFRQWITFDRYYLPLLPFALGLLLWALRDQRYSPPLALAALLLLGAVDVLGVQDWQAFKQAQWEAAKWLVTEGEAPLRQVDVGTEWDALHFYEAALADPGDRVPRCPGDPDWLYRVAPMVDPAYVVSVASPLRPGYNVLERWPVGSWIRSGEAAWVYALRRDPAVGSCPAGG